MSPHPQQQGIVTLLLGAGYSKLKEFKLAMSNTITTFTPDQILRAIKGWCWDCGSPCPNYRVHNTVWEAAWPDENNRIGPKKLWRLKVAATRDFPERRKSPDSGLVFVHVHLCFSCLELRLKRPLRITDFPITTGKDEPVAENQGILLGYRMGAHHVRLMAKKEAEDGDKKDEGG